MTSTDLEFDDVIYQNEKILCFDASNILYRSFYANKNIEEEHIDGLVHRQFLTTLNKYYKQLKPTKVVLTFDRPNWRKAYTKSEICVSKKIYKGNRRQDMTQKQQRMFELFMNCMGEFENLMRDHTSIITLSRDMLEADDLMAGIAEKYGNTPNELIIVTADDDMLQLLKHDNISIVNPIAGKTSTLKDWDYDWRWFLFVKMFRGDRGDNVEKALPRIRVTKLKEAYTDDYKRNELLQQTWSRLDDNDQEITFRVGDLYKENEMLMDLTKQPEYVKNIINDTINNGFANPGKFSMFHFLKFCGKHDLNKLADKVQDFVPMLSN